MINDLNQLHELVLGTTLESCQLAEIPILDTKQKAFAIRVNNDYSLSAWQVMRAKTEDTQRWPVLVACGQNLNGYWLQQISQANFFDRFPFQYEVNRENPEKVSPEIIISGSQKIDIDTSLQRLSQSDEEDLKEYLEYSLADTQENFGQSPQLSLLNQLIDDGTLNSELELERWLFNWEIQHFGAKATKSIDNSYLQWFEPVNELMALLLMPTLNGWEIPAYINWYGAESCSSELVVALLKYWHQKYGAELVAHYSTMLQLVSQTLPNSPEEALKLAWQQQVIAPCTTCLPGVSLRNHAREMLHCHQWFLHERP
jgi:hypothetical protein